MRDVRGMETDRLKSMTERERVARALDLEKADRPPIHLSFGASGETGVLPPPSSGGPRGWGAGSAGGGLPPFIARDWPIRAGVDVIEVDEPIPWPRLSFPSEEIRSDPERACRALLDQSWPDAADRGLYRQLERHRRTRPDRAFFYRVPGLFEQLETLLGFDVFMAAVERSPSLVQELVGRLVTTTADVGGEAARRGADALLFTEAVRGPEGEHAPMEHLDQWIFPFDRLLLEGPVQAGIPVVAHCPGADDALCRRFAALGARLVGPIPADVEVLTNFRHLWSDRLGIYGALDSARTIPYGQPEEIRRHVEEMFQLAGANGGLIFSAADLPPETPIGNLEALLDAVRACRY